MIREIDRIPSTITISMGLKNKIRKLKGNRTYEEFLSAIIRNKEEQIEGNSMELIEFERKNLTLFKWSFSILVEYNALNNSRTHIFDTRIKRIIHQGKEINLKKMIKIVAERAFSTDKIINNYKELLIYIAYEKIYKEIIETIIREETKANFSHRGRFVDFELWKKEFENLNLSRKAYETDIYKKIMDYRSGAFFNNNEKTI